MIASIFDPFWFLIPFGGIGIAVAIVVYLTIAENEGDAEAEDYTAFWAAGLAFVAVQIIGFLTAYSL